LTGGAVMLLVIQNRQTAKDVDAYFATNPQEIREAARVAKLLIQLNVVNVHGTISAEQ